MCSQATSGPPRVAPSRRPGRRNPNRPAATPLPSPPSLAVPGGGRRQRPRAAGEGGSGDLLPCGPCCCFWREMWRRSSRPRTAATAAFLGPVASMEVGDDSHVAPPCAVGSRLRGGFVSRPSWPRPRGRRGRGEWAQLAELPVDSRLPWRSTAGCGPPGSIWARLGRALHRRPPSGALSALRRPCLWRAWGASGRAARLLPRFMVDLGLGHRYSAPTGMVLGRCRGSRCVRRPWWSLRRVVVSGHV